MIPRRSATLAALLLLAACAGQQTTATGFLAAPPPAAEDGSRAFTAVPDRLRGYRSVWVEEVAFSPGAGAPEAPDAAELAALRASYRAALREAFAARNYLLLDAAPANPAESLRVRAAITGYERANVRLNLATTLLIGPVTGGGAASEAEVVDATTGERLAALSTHGNATPWLGGPLNYYRAHGHARAALARHAAALAAQLPRRPQNWADAR
ncbi:DUF3313 family protein [Falsiroseomonas selenitidurans]|uniref:DUF3313 domain-containing protein n=1 Tax=Falsiroseomonas selenitidurans TaxID=2716335 RepID=A0ABX1E445_9PROT|nr:DUF3313 family protein [Falsiroseomonas selenitidurans]NKC31944.1 DUF3313 domain-containing protein [Falsiroseomonas selenitidurans]